ncbi:MAG: nuclear transport factor 2 family protein, partial [Bacteroidales bacterium]|nr:nuclear transport factor 2 family protein [Bacteroidales bacterium]
KLEGWEEIKAAVKKQFSSFNETLISITDQSIWLNEDATVSWFFEELNYNFVYEGKAMTFKGIRFTGVMLKEAGEWKMVQQHMSIPAHLQMVEMHK